MRKYNIVPLTTLDALKLSNKDAIDYKKKVKHLSLYQPKNVEIQISFSMESSKRISIHTIIPSCNTTANKNNENNDDASQKISFPQTTMGLKAMTIVTLLPNRTITAMQ